MKYLAAILLSISLLISMEARAQYGIYREVVERSEWTKFIITGFFGSYVSFSKDVDGQEYVELKMVLDNSGPFIFGMRGGEKVTFTFDKYGDLSIPLPYSKVACYGCAAVGMPYSSTWGVRIWLPITHEEYKLFRAYDLQNLSFTYWDADDMRNSRNVPLNRAVSERIRAVMAW